MLTKKRKAEGETNPMFRAHFGELYDLGLAGPYLLVGQQEQSMFSQSDSSIVIPKLEASLLRSDSLTGPLVHATTLDGYVVQMYFFSYT